MRPSELAQDDTAMMPVLQHAVSELEKDAWKADIVVLLQPSSPMRKPKHIAAAIEKLINSDADSVVSVLEIPHLYAPQKALRKKGEVLQFWIEDGKSITRRQQLETSYAREGTVYAFWRDVLMEKNSIYGEKCIPLVLRAEESLTMDTEKDWQRAEKMLMQVSDKAG
jgi:CMP-N-acetylneuraminic acid synthetase